MDRATSVSTQMTVRSGPTRTAGEPRTSKPPLYIAVLREVHDKAPTSDPAVVQRIKHIREKGLHPGANEAEAKAALLLASRMMTKHNVKLAEVIPRSKTSEQSEILGELHTISIIRRDRDLSKPVRHNVYLGRLCNAIASFFAVTCITSAVRLKSKRSSLDIIFSGITPNASVAAKAFERTYNLMVEWAQSFKGASEKNSYCLGLSTGLMRIAEQEKEHVRAKTEEREMAALNAKIKEEEAQRQAQIDRLQFPSELEERNGLNSPTVKVEPGEDDPMDIDDQVPLERPIKLEPGEGHESDSDVWPDDEQEIDVGLDSDDDGSSVTSFDGHDFCPDFNEDVIDLTKDTDDEDDDDEAFRKLVSQKTEPSGQIIDNSKALQKELDEDTSTDCGFESKTQLIKFQHSAEQIAEETLKRAGYKVKKGRRRTIGKIHWNIHRKGEKDAEKIDLQGNKLNN